MSTEQQRFDAVLSKIADACKGYSADTPDRTVKFVRQFTAEYAEVLGLSQAEVIEAIEAKRDYSAPNFYQQANFPSLNGVRLFDTTDAFRSAIPSKQFRCPSCNGISTDPYECNSGDTKSDGETCNWKSYGLFRTLGKGLRIVIKEGFLENPQVHEIFMPLEFEQATA